MQRRLPYWQDRLASLLWVVMTVVLAVVAVAVGLLLLGMVLVVSLIAVIISALLMPFDLLKARLMHR